MYEVSKETGESELMNWKDAQKFMNGSFDQITKVLKKEAPDMAPFVGLVFLPLTEAFKSKENIEAYMETNIGYITAPFTSAFVLGETIEVVDTQENPFNKSTEISATTKLTLKEVNAETKNCIIHQQLVYDLSEFIEMMKSMVKSMATSFGVSDSSATAKTNEMDDFSMEMTNLQVVTFNYETTWVTKVVGTATVETTDPKDGVVKRKEVITTTIVN